MATSPLLRTLLGTNALLVSSHSNNMILSLQNGSWTTASGLPGVRGLAVGAGMVAAACSDGVHLFTASTGLQSALFNIVTQNSHEIEATSTGHLIACSSAKSCLTDYTFAGNTDIWTVPGVDTGTTDERSWINGVCLENDIPTYVTTLGISNVTRGWRDEAAASRGALIHVPSSSIVLHNLFFPHTPTIVGTDVYFLNSGHGQLCKWTPGAADYTVVGTYGGWARGLCQLDATHFAVGVSQGRLSAFPNLTTDPLAQPGIAIVDINTGQQIEFETIDVKEIFDIVISSNAIVGA